MTVRSWITISVLVLVALGAAFTVRVLSPIRAPALLASVEGRRLPAVDRGSCWAQRNGELRCVDATGGSPKPVEVPASGRIRIVAAYPVQPDQGSLVILGPRGDVVLEHRWTDALDYRLEPGRYRLKADARYPDGAYVRAEFALTATR